MSRELNHTAAGAPASYAHPNGALWEPSAWTRDLLSTLARRVDSGRLETCQHSGAARAWLSWLSDRLLCVSCAAAAAAQLRGTAEEWTCDRCAAYVENDCAPFVVPIVTRRHGLVSAWFGLCSTCKGRELL